MSERLTPNCDPRALAKELAGMNLINGQLVPAKSSKTFEVRSPATRELVAQAAYGESDDVADAVAAAKAAQKAWARMPARDRGKMIQECGRLLNTHKEELAQLVALETGKAIRTESRVEAGVLADAFTYYGGLGSELKGDSVPFNPEMMTITQPTPIGVIGAIIPWNVPMMLMAYKIAPALVAGNAVVVKSAEEAPFAVLRVCQIMNQVLPAGLFNMLSGYGPECGAPLVAHNDVGKITFTGSVDTGKIIYKTAADRLIPVTLELGGKSPMIVMNDADLDRAVAGAVSGVRFTRQGQSCTAASRIYVQDDLYDAFITKVKDAVDQMVMGDPLDEATDIGTIVSQDQFDRVQSYIEIGKSEGGTAIECSQLPADAALKDGFYVRPVIFTGLPETSRLITEEIFGPVTVVQKFSDYDAVIEAANDSVYGLAATIWTTNLKTAMDATQRLEAGFVQVNQNLVVLPNLSYGGIKQSGMGKEASLEAMLNHYTHKKTIIINMT